MPSPITSSGAIDVQGIVNSLVAAERRPMLKMQAEAKDIDSKISAYGKLQSQLSKFRDVANTLSNSQNWQPTQATSSQPERIVATAKPGAAAAQYSISVDALAGPQTVSSTAVASSNAIIGGGSLSIEMGQQNVSPSGFSPDPTRTSVTVTIPTNATLAQVRDAINGSNAGVRASIVRDGDGVRLLMSSSATGRQQAFRITVNDNDGNHTNGSGLSSLAYDPDATAGNGRNLSLVRSAEDARYTVDGLSLSAPGNRIVDALDGVDIELKQVTSTASRIDVSTNQDTLQANAKSFVDAYNELNTLLSDQTRYNAGTKIAGPLQGDSSAVGVLNRVRNIVKETMNGGTLTRLADVGMRLQKDGSLTLDNARLREAAAVSTDLTTLMTHMSNNPAERGLMRRIRDLGDDLLSTQGSVNTATSAWSKRKTTNTKQQESLENRVSEIQKRLLRQFSSLDAQLVVAQQNSNALSNALAGLPKNSG